MYILAENSLYRIDRGKSCGENVGRRNCEKPDNSSVPALKETRALSLTGTRPQRDVIETND